MAVDYGRTPTDLFLAEHRKRTRLIILDTLQSGVADNKLQISVVDGRRSSEKVMVLQGVLNAETAFHFRDKARQHVPEILVIDMRGVRYVDSSGIGVLIGLYVSFEQNSKRLLLAGISDWVWDLFRKCKIDDVFTRYATVADAELAAPNVDR